MRLQTEQLRWAGFFQALLSGLQSALSLEYERFLLIKKRALADNFHTGCHSYIPILEGHLLASVCPGRVGHRTGFLIHHGDDPVQDKQGACWTFGAPEDAGNLAPYLTNSSRSSPLFLPKPQFRWFGRRRPRLEPIFSADADPIRLEPTFSSHIPH